MQEDSRSPHDEGHTQANEGKARQAVYEIGFHLVPMLTEEEVAASFERLHKTLDNSHVTILAEETPKKLPLAYRIERSVAGRREKYAEAFFGFIKFEFTEADEAATPVLALEKMLREDSSVLRYLLIRTTREAPIQPKTVFASRSLEGRTIEKPVAAPEERAEISEEELDKSIEALVGDETTL